MKKGFTLVELSIVLVIIGLLIGGILVAQSMIGTAKIQALSRQLGQFDAAVNNFKTKYNQLPGDSNLMSDTFNLGISGNNDGIIGSNVDFFSDEIALFWPELQNIGFTNTTTLIEDSSGNNSGLGPSSYSPTAAAGKNAVALAFGSGVPGVNYYAIGDRGNTGYGISYNHKAFKPAEVLALDTKIDDGKADSGNVKGTDAGILSSIQAESGSIQSGTGCASGSTYASATTTEQCGIIRVRIGTTSGNLD